MRPSLEMALQLFLFALVLLCGRINHADASLSPMMYWKTFLPNTPMPPSIRDFFYPSTDYKYNELRDNVKLNNNPLLWWSATTPHELQDKVKLDNNPLIFWSATAPHELQDKVKLDNNPLIFWSATTSHELQDKVKLDNNPLIFWSATAPHELQDKVKLDNSPLIFWSATAPHELQDKVKLDNNPLIFWSATAPHELQDKVKLDNNPLIFWSATIPHELQDKVKLDNNPLIFWSATAPHELQDKVKLDNNPLIFWSATAPHELQDKIKLDNNAQSTAHKHLPTASHGLQDKATIPIKFFLEKDLFVGANLTVQIPNYFPDVDLLPRRIADALPFSTAKLDEILARLSIDPNSKEAKRMRVTLQGCEIPEMGGETKICATSLESMVDFIISQLGTSDVRAFSTITTLARGAESSMQAYTVTSRLRKIADVGTRSVACHPMDYAYAIFFCHDLGPSVREYAVTMTGSVDKTQAEMIVMCHTDTSPFDPNHLSFQQLNVKPGTEPICHLISSGNLLWVPNSQNQE